MTSALNSEQSAAVEAILRWQAAPGDDPFFVLEGSAGTGKTYCMPALTEAIRGSIVFTAPTNKATKVLRTRLTSDKYKPDARTTYSLLGLSLAANGEVRELSEPEDPVDLSDYRLMVVDEGSMVGGKLQPHIWQAAKALPVLYLGDRFQLPPVGEAASMIWKFPQRAVLEKVERYDNQILRLATDLREAMKKPIPLFKVTTDNNGDEGVWKQNGGEWLGRIMDFAGEGLFSKPDLAKAIAWRNVQVDHLNTLIRRRIFGPNVAAESFWVPGDRVVFTAPANTLSDEKMASTDDEGLVTNVHVEQHPLAEDFKVFSISITLDDNRVAVARVLHPESQGKYNDRVERLAVEARIEKRKWKDFWAFKELFHQLRHSYAITAHRSQGSTYKHVFVDLDDMLKNRERREATQCFYVGATRASKQLFVR